MGPDLVLIVALDLLRAKSRIEWTLTSLTRSCKIPVLKQGDYAIALMPSALADGDLAQLRVDLLCHLGRYRSTGVIIDVTALDVIDSFATRTIRDLALTVRLRGARAVIVGIQPEVAFAMVQLGLHLGDVATALDLEEGLGLLSDAA